MPLVNMKIIEGVFSPAQKAQLVHNLTEAVVAVEGETLRGSPGSSSRRSRAEIGPLAVKH